MIAGMEVPSLFVAVDSIVKEKDRADLVQIVPRGMFNKVLEQNRNLKHQADVAWDILRNKEWSEEELIKIYRNMSEEKRMRCSYQQKYHDLFQMVVSLVDSGFAEGPVKNFKKNFQRIRRRQQ